jgi:capsule polysaccharide export protein KpsE/RkpR
MISLVIGALSFVLPKWYEGRAVILPPTNDSSQFGAGGLSGLFGMSSLVDAFSSSNDGQERFLAILKSDRMLQTLAGKFDFQSKYGKEDLESTIETLRKKMSILIEDENQIIVSILDQDQNQVAAITNETVRILDSLNIVLSNSQARSSRMFIEVRVHEVLDSLKSLEVQLTHFMETEGVMSLEDQVTVGVQQAAEMQALITAKEVELSVAEQMMEAHQPIVGQLRHELSQLKKDYQEFFKSDTADQLLPSFSDVPELATNLTRLQRAIEYNVKLLEFLGPQYEQAKIDEVKDIPTLQVLDWAVRPEDEARPRKILIILGGFLLGFFLAYFSVYIKDFKTKYYV